MEDTSRLKIAANGTKPRTTGEVKRATTAADQTVRSQVRGKEGSVRPSSSSLGRPRSY